MQNHVPPPSPALTPAQSIERLVALLDVEALGDDRFRGHSTEAGWQRVYGGQVIAQALMAASKTVPADRPAHSLHAYFMRPGDPKESIVYRVERDRDGASFSSRRIIALQYGKAIFSMSASFQVEETGLEHTTAMPAERVSCATDSVARSCVSSICRPACNSASCLRWLRSCLAECTPAGSGVAAAVPLRPVPERISGEWVS